MFSRLPVQLVMCRVSDRNGQFLDMRDDTVCYLDPCKIDTFQPLTPARRVDQAIPQEAITVIRYMDHVAGFRLMYVKDTAQWINRALFKLGEGGDPDSIDFTLIPNGI